MYSTAGCITFIFRLGFVLKGLLKGSDLCCGSGPKPIRILIRKRVQIQLYQYRHCCRLIHYFMYIYLTFITTLIIFLHRKLFVNEASFFTCTSATYPFLVHPLHYLFLIYFFTTIPSSLLSYFPSPFPPSPHYQ